MVNPLETKSKDRAVLGSATSLLDGHGLLMGVDSILLPFAVTERKKKSDLSQNFSGTGHNLIALISSPAK